MIQFRLHDEEMIRRGFLGKGPFHFVYEFGGTHRLGFVDENGYGFVFPADVVPAEPKIPVAATKETRYYHPHPFGERDRELPYMD